MNLIIFIQILTSYCCWTVSAINVTDQSIALIDRLISLNFKRPSGARFFDHLFMAMFSVE